MSTSSEERQRVIYVVGYGRSGSTVFDAALGNHPEIVSVGELTNLVASGWIGGLYCSCGETAPDCPFWRRVRDEALRLWGDEDLEGYVRLQRRFEPLWRLAGLQAAESRGAEELLEYRRRTALLFEAVRQVAGRSVVVDSSKGAPRARALAGMASLDLRIVHLVRDPRGTAYSYLRRHARDDRAGVQREFLPRPAWQTSLAWMAHNLAAERLCAASSRPSLRLRYEDFTRVPREAFARVGDVVGLDLTVVAEAIATGAPLRTGHVIAGNRVRMRPTIEVRADERWRSEMEDRDRRRVERLASPLLREYGYER